MKFQFLLVSVSEETDFSLALSETMKTGFVASRPISGWARSLNMRLILHLYLYFVCTSSETSETMHMYRFV